MDTPESKSQIKRFLHQSPKEFADQLTARMAIDCGRYWRGEDFNDLRSLILDHEAALILIRKLTSEDHSR